ncbi:MAG: copper(I)-binding protein [Paracoccaceae bacterium]|jgi:copper(I)-binding protein
MFRTLVAGAIALFAVLPAHAEILAHDAYARSTNQKTGAAFMQLMNDGKADRLVEVRSDIARKVELHTHIFDNGIAKMRQVEGGIPLPAGETLTLERGGLHVMFMGLTQPLNSGESFPLTLMFESGATLQINVTVDNERRPDQPMTGHDQMKGHGAM